MAYFSPFSPYFSLFSSFFNLYHLSLAATTSENTEQANASRNLLNANRTNEDRGTSLSTSNGPENHSTSMNRSKSKESIV